MPAKDTMGVMDAIRERHSVRTFTEEPVSAADLRSLIEAARLAPSSLNSQPWRFKVVTDPALIARFGDKSVTRSQRWLARAGAIIVCCADLTGYVRDSQASAFFYRKNDLIKGDVMDGIEAYVEREASATESARFGAAAMNVALSMSNIMLRAVELGLGTCWVGMFVESEIKAMLGLDPALRIVGLLAVGHPAPGQSANHGRKSLDEILLP